MYRLKIIQYKGEFSILMEFSTLRYFDTKNSSDFNSFSSSSTFLCKLGSAQYTN